MANEFKHLSVGGEISQAEYEAVGGHVLASQAIGDIIYATSTSQLSRLGIGSTGAVLTVTGGIPAWDTTWTPTGDLIPATDDTYDLGSASAAWQDLFLEGDITLTDAGTLATSAGALTITSAAAATWSTSAGALTVTSAGALNLNPAGGSAIVLDTSTTLDGGVLTFTPSTSDTVVMTAATNGAFSLVTTDNAAAAANIQITADGTVDIDSAGILTLDSGAAINIEPASGSAVLIDGTVSIDGGAVTGVTNLTASGELDAATLDLSSSADIAGDLVLSGGADGALQFTNAGENSIKIPDNQASALIIEEADNAYITFVTTDSSEAITVAKATSFSSDIDVDGTANLDNTDIDGTLVADGTNISLDSTTTLNIDNSNTSNGITIGTATSGVPISIGHTTSETTVNENLTVTGNLTVNGTTATVSTTNTIIEDTLIELNTGAGSNANDLGIVMERGSTGNNAIIAWDESEDAFVVGTTTATGASTGSLTIAAADFSAAAITGTSIVGGTVSGTTAAFSGLISANGGITFAAGDDIAFTGGSTTNDITLTDSLADALSITRDGTDMVVFDSNTPRITFTPVTTFTGAITASGGVSGALTGNADTVTTNANLTGDVTSSGNATTIAAGVIIDNDVKSDAAIAISKTALVAGTGITLSTNTLSVDASQGQVTTVGALDAGSITSGFTSIDVGSGGLTTTGAIAGGTIDAGTDFTIGSTVITDGVLTDSGGFRLPESIGVGLDPNVDHSIYVRYTETISDNDTHGSFTSQRSLAKTSEFTGYFAGVLSSARINTDNTGAWSHAVGLRGVSAQANILSGVDGAVTGAAALYAEANVNSGNAALTNSYGLYIESQTAGTNDYAIWMGGTPVIHASLPAASAATNISLDGSNNFQQDTSLRENKENIASLTGWHDMLTQLKPVEYDWRDGVGITGLDSRHDFGFIADEAESVDKRFASYSEGKLQSVRYQLTVVPLVAGWQNHETKITTLENRISELESQLESA
jgi:hypothetical protein